MRGPQCFFWGCRIAWEVDIKHRNAYGESLLQNTASAKYNLLGTDQVWSVVKIVAPSRSDLYREVASAIN
jgi:hypothetical protein